MKRIAILTMVMLVAAISLASAASVDPRLEINWPFGDSEADEMMVFSTNNNGIGSPADECEAAGGCDGTYAFKIDEWDQENGMDGTYDGGNITISESDGYTFSWDSNYSICTVIVKGGNDAYIYHYNPAVDSDENLVAPLNTDTKNDLDDTYSISHVTFCFSDDDPSGGTNEIPEFPTVALPIAAILGLAFLFQRRKE